MARRKRRQTSRLSYAAVTIVTAAAVCALFIWAGVLKDKNAECIERESRLYAELEQESIKNGELEKKYDYVKTDDYVEDMAKACFDLVKNQGDMLVKPNE